MWNDANLFINVNQKAIKLFGLETATYFSVITQIVDRVLVKQTADENGFFSINRKFVEDKIGLNIEQQYHCDTILIRHNILRESIESRDKIVVDLKQYFSILTETDSSVLDAIKKKSILSKSSLEKDVSNARAALRAEERKQKAEQLELEKVKKEEKRKKEAEQKEIKNAAIRNNMKNIALNQPLVNSEELQKKIKTWVDSIYDKPDFLTKAAIEIFCKNIKTYVDKNKVNPIDLIEIATARSYKDANWVVSVYESQHKSQQYNNQSRGNATKVTAEQKIATDNTINTELLF